MEAGRARYRDDSTRLPTLSLGLSSVRLIVNKIEAENARASAFEETGREITKYDPNIDEGYDDYYDPLLDKSRGRVWSRFAVNLGISLSRCVPSVTFWNLGVFAVAASFVAPRMISYLLLYPFCRLVFGTLYPAYASYKAVRTKNLKEYVKWMMYWIVFALFTCTETFTDVFLSWFPFYYEVKIVLVLWLLSPATKGSSILYRKFVHPALCRREQEIDEYIAKAKDQGYHTVLNLGTKGVNYATTVIMQTAIKGGGGLVQQLRKSYSLSDLSECEPREERGGDEADDVMTEPRLIRRATVKSGYSTRRSASESNSRSPMYFPEVDVDMRSARTGKEEPDFSHIKSSEDISSGYSSADNSASLTRTASLNAAARAKLRTRTTVTTIKRPQAAEENEVIIEELQDDETFDYTNMPPLLNLSQNLFISNTEPPFIYQLVGDQVRVIQVLGSSNNSTFNNENNNNTDRWDQKEANFQDASSTIDSIDGRKEENEIIIETNNNSIHENKEPTNTKTPLETIENIEDTTPLTEQKGIVIEVENPTVIQNDLDNKETCENQDVSINEQTSEVPKTVQADISKSITVTEDPTETTSLETSMNENDSSDSDDEASFGTPENSPKSKRRSPKGKYGKGKAPPPPSPIQKDKIDDAKDVLAVSDSQLSTTSQESLTDLVKRLPNTAFKETGSNNKLQVVNPIAEKKRRHKSKSPGRIPKSSGSGIGKLLHLPGKLAFWSKNDDKTKENPSTSSGDRSRRSSTIEKTAEDFQSCYDINEFLNATNKDIFHDTVDDNISFKDAEIETISHDIIEKSDELQKLIEAKIENHPEYKFVSLHDEIPTTSKSTDV